MSSSTLKLLCGLGNPGTQYAKTRHNAGFMVVDRLAQKHGQGRTPTSRFKGVAADAAIGGSKCLLLKPLTFMNLSGQSVADAVGFYKLNPAEDLLVIVDDLYLPTGAVRLKPCGGTGGHNGLTDVQRGLGTDNYPRLRLGVGLQPNGGKPPMMDQADFVLSRFTEDEEPLLAAAIDKAVEGAELWASRGLAHAMNTVNAGEKKLREEKDPQQS